MESIEPTKMQDTAAFQQSESSTPTCTKICPSLDEFYRRHGVESVDEKLDALSSHSRFIRLNPRHDKQETLRLLQAELVAATTTNDNDNQSIVPVPWLDESFGFYAIPGTFSLAQSQVFQSGRIYGMDVSSGAAVSALFSNQQPSLNDCRVLDLCCSPGLKLCMIADLLPLPSCTLVGVDISEQRLSVCKRIVKKYRIDPATCGTDAPSLDSARIRLYCADGTTFADESNPELVFDSIAAVEDQQVAGKRKRMNKSARARERKRLRQLASLDKHSSSTVAADDNDKESTPMIRPFDYVMVDAECSTDGSLKHVQQRASKLSPHEVATNTTLTDPKQLESLVELQKGLILSGFKLLKPGGTLVYSTCSLSMDQNENVVKWLLESNDDAFIDPVAFPLADSKLVVRGSLEGTIRFLPASSATNDTNGQSQFFGGGFFLARLGKCGAVLPEENDQVVSFRRRS